MSARLKNTELIHVVLPDDVWPIRKHLACLDVARAQVYKQLPAQHNSVWHLCEVLIKSRLDGMHTATPTALWYCCSASPAGRLLTTTTCTALPCPALQSHTQPTFNM